MAYLSLKPFHLLTKRWYSKRRSELLEEKNQYSLQRITRKLLMQSINSPVEIRYHKYVSLMFLKRSNVTRWLYEKERIVMRNVTCEMGVHSSLMEHIFFPFHLTSIKNRLVLLWLNWRTRYYNIWYRKRCIILNFKVFFNIFNILLDNTT